MTRFSRWTPDKRANIVRPPLAIKHLAGSFSLSATDASPFEGNARWIRGEDRARFLHHRRGGHRAANESIDSLRTGKRVGREISGARLRRGTSAGSFRYTIYPRIDVRANLFTTSSFPPFRTPCRQLSAPDLFKLRALNGNALNRDRLLPEEDVWGAMDIDSAKREIYIYIPFSRERMCSSGLRLQGKITEGFRRIGIFLAIIYSWAWLIALYRKIFTNATKFFVAFPLLFYTIRQWKDGSFAKNKVLEEYADVRDE